MSKQSAGLVLPGLEQGAWHRPAPAWRVLAADAVELSAPPRSDRFFDPVSGRRQADSPAWLATTSAPATLVAHVGVAFRGIFDAAVLMVYERADAWAKLCFEQATDGRPTVVSVVTRGTSDDANGWPVQGERTWLRVSVLPVGYAFHASSDGRRWDLVRLFRLGRGTVRRVGLSVQAPVGAGCTAVFESVSLRPGATLDVRSGL